MEGVTVYGHALECHVTFRSGVLHILLWYPISTIELTKRWLQKLPEISLSWSLYESRAALRIKQIVSDASLGVSLEPPEAGEEGILLLKNGKFVILKLKSSLVRPLAHGQMAHELATCWSRLQRATSLTRYVLHNVKGILIERKEENWPRPMNKAPIPTVNSKEQIDKTKRPAKKLDFKTNVDRMRTVSWSICCYQNGVV